MALIPASIFLFTLIPFVPIHNFQKELIRLFENILPYDAFNFLETTRALVLDILMFLKWIVIILLVFLTISFLYYYAPAKRTGFRFFSAGSTLATILFILTSLGFSAYVNKSGRLKNQNSLTPTLIISRHLSF